MNILHLSTTDAYGGAAQASYAIHNMLREAGHYSQMLVGQKTTDDSDVHVASIKALHACSWAEIMERGRARLTGGHGISSRTHYMFNRNLGPVYNWNEALTHMKPPDVIFLHWITNFLTAADVRRIYERLQCPMVWVLMDMEPLTGGCHYPGECRLYQTVCRNCPQLVPRVRSDWASRTWHAKSHCLADIPITFVAPTRWLADRLACSSLFAKHVCFQISLPISARMRPFDRSTARRILDLPVDCTLVLVGSHSLADPRKGVTYLLEALKLLAGLLSKDAVDKIRILIVGLKGREFSKAVPFPVHDMGYQGEIMLSLIYQAVDVFACSSVEDAGPVMISQAMMCGTPVVAFDTGIAPELLGCGTGGYLARLKDSSDFAHGLKHVIGTGHAMRAKATKIASIHHDRKRILNSYEQVLATVCHK